MKRMTIKQKLLYKDECIARLLDKTEKLQARIMDMGVTIEELKKEQVQRHNAQVLYDVQTQKQEDRQAKKIIRLQRELHRRGMFIHRLLDMIQASSAEVQNLLIHRMAGQRDDFLSEPFVQEHGSSSTKRRLDDDDEFRFESVANLFKD